MKYLLPFLLAALPCLATKPALPNFVIIFIDDLGFADIGCFGATDIRTPRIDQIAEKGMKFTHFYAQHI
jgi:arylsulfatase A